jgi:hypothetical protein
LSLSVNEEHKLDVVFICLLIVMLAPIMPVCVGKLQNGCAKQKQLYTRNSTMHDSNP